MPAVGADHEIGPDLDRAVALLCPYPENAALFLDQIDNLAFRVQVKIREAAALLGEEIEEIPLRHQRDKAAAGRQVAEIGKGDLGVADQPVQLTDLLMWAR